MLGFWDPTTPISNAAPSTLNVPGFLGAPRPPLPHPPQETSGYVPAPPPWYPQPHLVLHQHGDVHEHVVELLDAALQPHDVLVPALDLAEGLLGNLRVDDLWRATERWTIGPQACHSPPGTLAGLPPPNPTPSLTPEVKMAGFPLSSISSSSSSVVFLPAL